MADLDAYRRKRDAAKTPEPFGGSAGGGPPIFVVQRHDARRLHYDFRLERGGALASWAVPKGIPLEPGAKALAVHVEDHPLEYASFAGEIPAGQYGAGTVEIRDHGTYELLAEKPDGELSVRLHGDRLRGSWTLVPAALDGKEQNWLLIRGREQPDEPGSGDGVPARYTPMLATLTRELPRQGSWRYEVKFDGYRALAVARDGSCALWSRNGNDLGRRFPTVAQAIGATVSAASAVLDGEICALDEQGAPRFSLLQQDGGRLVYYAFDCLELDGAPLVDLPLEERRERLEAIVGDSTGGVLLSESFEDGEALLAAVHARGLEGIVAKRAGSRYVPGRRSPDWLKLKTHEEQEFVVVGYTAGKGSRAGSFGALVLAVSEGGELRYAGNVGSGFDTRELERLRGLLDPLRRSDAPLPDARIERGARASVTWVEPRLVVEVAFSEWTHDGHVRQPTYVGLRDDRVPREVRRERAAEETLRSGRRELRLVNLDKIFWPEQGLTKGDLLDYYRAVATVLVPHLRGRPFTMRRYPDGIAGKAFFQKDAPVHMPGWIKTFATDVHTRASATKRVEFPLVDDELALMWMVNMGCIDMNAWYSRVDRPDRPDFVLFDLDPTPEVPYTQTVEVALILKGLLDGLDLRSFPKTSGGKGFHVLVPLDRRSTYEDTRGFAERVAGVIAAAYPALATTAWSKAKRRGVLIDANQNGLGKTIASVYSVRPHPGAPVSTPLSWDEVTPELDPAAFTFGSVLDRVERLGDLHEGVLRTRQSLNAALRALASGKRS